MNGFEATKAIRKAGIKVLIIAVTAFALVGDRKRCLDVGCNDYISKPIEYRELLEMLQKYLPYKTSV
jgi:CheY-like chemotaxis protein